MMRLFAPIKFVRVVEEVPAVGSQIKITVGEDIEIPGAAVACVMSVVRNVKNPRKFSHLVWWRDEWWHMTIDVNDGGTHRYGLQKIGESDEKHRRAARWADRNVVVT